MQGIDVSSAQGNIDVGAVPCDFVIAKATQGTGYVNPNCAYVINRAMALGKPNGTYLYVGGGNAVGEADHYLDTVAGWIGKGTLNVDFEAKQNSAYGDWGYLSTVVSRIIQRSGIRPLIYGSLADYGNLKKVADQYGCKLWIAQYANQQPTGYQDTPWNEGRFDCVIRQYSSKGMLPNFGGNLDLDKFYGSIDDWNNLATGGTDMPLNNDDINAIWTHKLPNGEIVQDRLMDAISDIIRIHDQVLPNLPGTLCATDLKGTTIGNRLIAASDNSWDTVNTLKDISGKLDQLKTATAEGSPDITGLVTQIKDQIDKLQISLHVQ